MKGKITFERRELLDIIGVTIGEVVDPHNSKEHQLFHAGAVAACRALLECGGDTLEYRRQYRQTLWKLNEVLCEDPS